jgi:hypothetical protein
MKMKKEPLYNQISGRGKRPEKEQEVIRVYPDFIPDKKIADHGIFERKNSGIVWQVLNYKDQYAIWDGKIWSNNTLFERKYNFSLKPAKDVWQEPCFRSTDSEIVRVVFDSKSPFYVKNIFTGNIYIVNPDETAELLYDNEDEFLRIQEYLHK